MTRLDLCARLLVKPGQVIISKCNGGGGYGDPFAREPERVLRDVREGWVSRSRARHTYGVAITEELVIDALETAAMRVEHSQAEVSTA